MIFKHKLIYNPSDTNLVWGFGDWGWGWGLGDWGLGPIPNPQSPIPNPHLLL